MARPKGKAEVVPRRKISDEFSDPLQLTDEILDKCIEVYLSTGNWAAVGRAVGRSRAWALQLFRTPRCLDRMKQKSLEIRGNTNIANIEECMQKLTSIMRGDQIKELAESVRRIVEAGGSSVQIEDAVDRIARFAPQVENNQIKATTMLLTAQGAMDPNRAAKEDSQAVIDEIILQLAKSEGSVDAILDGIRQSAKIEVIDVTPE